MRQQAGQFSLGRWDPGADFARHDTIPIFHGHSPRVSFGGHRALALGVYSSFDGPGSADIGPLDPEDVQWPSRWPDHFVAAMIGGIHGRFAGAISGRIELDAHEPYTHPRWGDTHGRLVVELEIAAPDGAGEREWTTMEVDFHVPSFWFVSYETGGSPASAGAVFLGEVDGAGFEPRWAR